MLSVGLNMLPKIQEASISGEIRLQSICDQDCFFKLRLRIKIQLRYNYPLDTKLRYSCNSLIIITQSEKELQIPRTNTYSSGYLATYNSIIQNLTFTSWGDSEGKQYANWNQVFLNLWSSPIFPLVYHIFIDVLY